MRALSHVEWEFLAQRAARRNLQLLGVLIVFGALATAFPATPLHPATIGGWP